MRIAIVLLIMITCSSCNKTSERTFTEVSTINKAETQVAQRDSTFTSFDGTTIFYKDEGTGNPLLVLHGFIANGSSWYTTALVQQAKAEGYRVIIPDMRGNGKSGKPQEPTAYKDDAEVKDLIALMHHLDLKQYQAIGYSRGSIVLAALLTQDTRITKAVIGGMGLDFSNPDWNRRIAFANAFSGRAPLDQMTQGAVQYATSINADLKVLGMLQDHQPVTSVAALNKITIPILVIAGNKDTDNGNPKELQQALGNATLTIIPGDHNTSYRTEAFATAVLPFLTKH